MMPKLSSDNQKTFFIQKDKYYLCVYFVFATIDQVFVPLHKVLDYIKYACVRLIVFLLSLK
jgi:hypothetical protein